jgi:hypothetical protein
MAEDKNLESRALIAQAYGSILRKVIIKILDGGAAGTTQEDQQIYDERRTRKGKDNPRQQNSSRPLKPQRPQINAPVQTTLPERPEIQPIPIPPYQPPINQPSPESQPAPNTTTPFVNPNFARERDRLQKDHDALLRRIAEQQKRNDEAKSGREQINRDHAKTQRGFEDARSRLLRDANKLDQQERDQNKISNTNRPFDNPGSSLTFLNSNPFGSSRVLQTNSLSEDISFGDRLIRAMQESLTSGVLKDGFVKEMEKLLTPENLATMGGLLAVVGSANIAATAIGGPIGAGISATELWLCW